MEAVTPSPAGGLMNYCVRGNLIAEVTSTMHRPVGISVISEEQRPPGWPELEDCFSHALAKTSRTLLFNRRRTYDLVSAPT
jgi:hypothetical protein